MTFVNDAGDNGKNKLLECISLVSGPFYGTMDDNVIFHKGNQDRGLVLLEGCRIARVSEIQKTDKINHKQLKRLTGDDFITYRRLYKELVTRKFKISLILCFFNQDFA